MERILAYFTENKVMAVLLAAGILMIGFGCAKMLRESHGETLEVIEPSRELPQAQSQGVIVIVDVSGAVASPSVYKLDQGARVAEALVAAGGLTAEADTEWVGQRLNQAEVVRDGMKLYIPYRNEMNNERGSPLRQGFVGQAMGNVAGVGTVNVNNASESELDSLWGIGATRAQDIIENRPYGSLEELVTKAGIPKNVLEKNQDKMTY